MTNDEKKLRELAEKATPGPWEPCPHRMYVFSARGEMIADECEDNGIEMRGHGAGLSMEENCEYIAAASPDVVLAILDENARLRSAVREYAEAKDHDAEYWGSQRFIDACEELYALGRECVKAGKEVE